MSRLSIVFDLTRIELLKQITYQTILLLRFNFVYTTKKLYLQVQV